MLRELVVKELLMLAVFAAIGSGLTRLLPRRIDVGTRLALAPSFGYAASLCILVTLNFFVGIGDALWYALVPAALLSVAMFVRGRPPRPSLRDVAQLGLVVACVLASFNYPLHERHSVGPIAFAVHDAPGYVTCIDGFSDHRTNKPLTNGDASWSTSASDTIAWQPAWNQSDRYCWGYKFQHSGEMAAPAAFAAGLDWAPWRTLSPWMVTVMLLAGLGAMGLVRVLTGAPTWAGAAAGAAMAGAPLVQPFMDGSAGLISGTAFVPSLVAIGTLAVQRRSWRVTFLGALLLAGLASAYPEIGVVVVGGYLVFLASLLARRWWRGRALWPAIRAGLPYLVGAGALALVLSPRATLWVAGNVSFVKDVLNAGGLPAYTMKPEYIVGWLFQTREFYSWAVGVAPPGFGHALMGTMLPLVLIALIAWAVPRRPGLGLMLAIAGVAAFVSWNVTHSNNCSYCVDRTMTPVAAIAIAGAVVALRELALDGRRLIAGGLALMLLLGAGLSLRTTLRRAVDGGYMTAPDLGTMGKVIRKNVDAPLQLEGFTQSPGWSLTGGPLTYYAAIESTRQRVSQVMTYSDYGGLGYVPARAGTPGVTYDPSYGYVLTRFAALDSGRQVIRRTRTMSLQKRVGPFDAVIARGVAVNPPDLDANGVPWLQPQVLNGVDVPLTFWVSAATSGAAYVRVRVAGNFDRNAMTLKRGQRGATRKLLSNGELEFCVPALGASGLRVITLGIDGVPGGVGGPPPQPPQAGMPIDPRPRVAEAAYVNRVRVGATPCRVA